MNVEAFRHFYNYHFAENRSIWDKYITSLSDELFTQPVEYSIGSVRDQIVHVMNVDYAWFSDLRGSRSLEDINPDELKTRESIRDYGDKVEQLMSDYLATLTDEMLATKPLTGEDKDLRIWQVLLQVVNHGTDHRAQILRILHDLGVKTVSQDYIFYVYDHLV